jgi:hypothetical protein
MRVINGKLFLLSVDPDLRLPTTNESDRDFWLLTRTKSWIGPGHSVWDK